jgi:8-amino-7-oxononanoate synthase
VRDERLNAAAAEAARVWGTGSTGCRLVTGTTVLRARLEAALAEFTGAAGALVFSSGYLANLTVVTALVAVLGAPNDRLIVSDAGNHASLIDARRLSRARVTLTPHRDPDAVRKVLANRYEAAAIVVSDAVFSVDGALGPGGRTARGCSFGQCPPRPIRGACLRRDRAWRPRRRRRGRDRGRTRPDPHRYPVQGARRGARRARVIVTLVDTGRGFIFDTGLAPPCVGAALAALEVVAAEEDLRVSAP